MVSSSSLILPKVGTSMGIICMMTSESNVFFIFPLSSLLNAKVGQFWVLLCMDATAQGMHFCVIVFILSSKQNDGKLNQALQ